MSRYERNMDIAKEYEKNKLKEDEIINAMEKEQAEALAKKASSKEFREQAKDILISQGFVILWGTWFDDGSETEEDELDDCFLRDEEDKRRGLFKTSSHPHGFIN